MAGENEGSTPEVAVSPREAMMKSIIQNDLTNKEAEIREGGGTPIAAADLLQPGEEVAPLERPETVTEEDWESLTLEGKAEAVRNAAPAAKTDATTTDEGTTGTGEQTGATTETAAAAEETGTTSAAAAAKSGRTIKIKVDGQEIEVPEEEIIAAGIKTRQQETAADRRFEDARRAREDADRILAEARELKETLGAATPNQGAAPAQGDDADIDAIAHALQYGSKDEAKAALVKLKSAGALSDQQIAAQIDARIAFQDGVNFYRTEFKDIAANPRLHKLFLLEEQDARKAGDSRPYRELYADIGGQLVKDFNLRPAKPGATDAADQLAAKRAAKQTQTPQPTSASARQPAPQSEREPTEAEARASGFAQLQRNRPGAR